MGDAFRLGCFTPIAAPESLRAWVMSHAPATDADALKLLRGRFTDRPLSLRLAALDFLMRQRPAPSAALGSQ
jgi:hypothetical protein